MDISSDDEDAPPQLVAMPALEPEKVVPITVLTGFLGSGKTTLMQYVLTQNHGKRIAVIENEFSSGLGIEGMIAKNGVDGTNVSDFVELTNGCICCSIKGDLLITLEKLVMHKDRFDYIIIETTGLANPGPVISSFWSDDAIMSSVKLDGVICLVDCLNIEKYLEAPDISTDVRTQICYADRILLNKTDLVQSEIIPDIEEKIKQLNSIAEIKQSQYSRVNLDFVLNINGYTAGATEEYDVERVITCAPCFPPAMQGVRASKASAVVPIVQAEQQQQQQQKSRKPLTEAELRGLLHVQQDASAPHLASVLTTHSVKIDGQFEVKPLEVYLDTLLFSARSEEIMKTVQEDIVASKTNSVSTLDSNSAAAAAVTVKKVTDESVSRHVFSVGQEKNKIFRMKGALHVQGSAFLYILQTVHDVFELTQSSIKIGSPADKTNNTNVFIVIGKNIDIADVEADLRNCLTSMG